MDERAALRRLIDKDEIRDRMLGYCRGIDRGDVALVQDAYHPDALDFHGGRFTLSGEAIGPALVEGANKHFTDLSHLVGNDKIEIEGDVAFSEFYFVATGTMKRGDREFTRTRAGRYLDRWERRSDEWRIAHRTVVDDWSRVDEVVERAILGEHYTHGTRTPEDPVFHLRKVSQPPDVLG